MYAIDIKNEGGSPVIYRSNPYQHPEFPTALRNDDCPLETLLTTDDGQPYVFWDHERWRLLIKHGSFVTVVYYDRTDAKSCREKLTPLDHYGKKEQYIYYRGRPVASYLARLNVLVIKRDGEIFTFDNPDLPIGYNVRSVLDIYVEMAAYMRMKADWYD